MSVSTGRGGAGNMTPQSPQLNPQISKHSNIEASYNGGHDLMTSLSASQRKDGEVYYSTGRGGAGNLNKGSNIPSPKLTPKQSNSLIPVFSTGRGGYGNMTKISDVGGTVGEEEEGLAPISSQKSFAVGRGGYGNFVQNGEDETDSCSKKWLCF